MRSLLSGRRRLLVVAVVVVVVLAGGTGAWLLTRTTTAAAAISTATVTTQTIQQTVSADGTLEAARTAEQDFAVSGTVTAVLVSEGDGVRKGQVLARVDDTALVATRRAAQASLTAAVTQLDEDTDDGASDVALAADNAAVVSARATLADARQAVEDATLRADIAGTVTTVGLEVGDVAGTGSSSASSSGTGGTSSGASSTGSSTSSSSAFEIVSSGRYLVEATVAASDVEQLKKGLQAEITVTGVDDTVYGTVSSVGLVAETSSSGAAVFPVTVEVTGQQDGLYAGTSATVSIIVEQRDDVLTVDSRALSTEDGATYVDKVTDDGTVHTEVEVGETFGMATEILSGLAEGDEVEVAGFAGFGDRSGTGEEGQQMPGGGEMPDFSQMGGQMGGQPPVGGAGQ